MAIFISYPISTRDTHISPRAIGPRVDMGVSGEGRQADMGVSG